MVKFTFWFLIGLVIFIYFLYPVILFCLAQLIGKRRKKEDNFPFVSLIIPLHNEERVIRHKIDNCLALNYPQDKLEIIFALDDCQDKTKDILSEYRDLRIRIIDGPGRKGKVATLNMAVPEAKGELIVFSDANSLHHKDTIKTLAGNFFDKKVGCVCGKLCYTDTESTSISKGENLYWKYEYFIKTQESKLGKLLITNGSVQAVRKELYPYPDPEVADDFSIPVMILANGHEVLYEPEAIVYEAATQSLKEEFRQKVRIIAQGFKGIMRLRRYLLRLGPIGLFQLLFHKLFRWCVPLFLVIVFFANLVLIHEKPYFNLFVLQTAFYLLAVTGFVIRRRSKIKIFYIPFYFCLVNLASLFALLSLAKGRKTHIWEKAHSTRRMKHA
ncbi:MAG: glycosyltransferase family 2 protein [Candidatus Omnitrophota bacterium]|jgi:cellulose synthase/poly-beta-1,6-N-acetylglucosamine synthase-like glycosyltransferase|nr:MAG: glycosyltransferase family 2 protein [Candidatus Omnitrophota bacterium]